MPNELPAVVQRAVSAVADRMPAGWKTEGLADVDDTAEQAIQAFDAGAIDEKQLRAAFVPWYIAHTKSFDEHRRRR